MTYIQYGPTYLFRQIIVMRWFFKIIQVTLHPFVNVINSIWFLTEASVLLTGQSIIEHKFKLPLSAQQTNTEQFTLQFRTTNANLLKSGKDMVLIYIKGR